MHLLNILNQLGASEEEKKKIKEYFSNKVVAYKDVVNYFCSIRGISENDLLN